jgi:hypothetical protein
MEKEILDKQRKESMEVQKYAQVSASEK